MPTDSSIGHLRSVGTLPQGGNYLVLCNFDNTLQNNTELSMWAVIPGSFSPYLYPDKFGLDTTLGWDSSIINVAHSYWKLQ